MSLFYSVVFLSIGMTLARLIFAGVRQPKRPWWARESLATSVLIVVTGMLAFGVAFLAEAAFSWEDQVIGMAEIVAILGTIMAAVVLWVLMGSLLPVSTKAPVVSLPQTGPEAPDHGPATVPPAESSARRCKAA